jgi:hypothetical protein
VGTEIVDRGVGIVASRSLLRRGVVYPRLNTGHGKVES